LTPISINRHTELTPEYTAASRQPHISLLGPQLTSRNPRNVTRNSQPTPRLNSNNTANWQGQMGFIPEPLTGVIRLPCFGCQSHQVVKPSS